MDIQSWSRLFGRTSDDEELKAALAAAGHKKTPKLRKDHTFVQFDLKGWGGALTFTDEAFVRDLADQDIGEGPLLFSGAMAYLSKSVSDQLYQQSLPWALVPGMSRSEVRAKLGAPARTAELDDPPILDAWDKDGMQVIATYSDDELLELLALRMPGA